MRYLHNYKGTTLPLWADRVKNWLLSFPLAFFPHPSIQEGDVRQRWGGEVGGGTSRRHTGSTLHSEKPITIQRAEPCRSNRRSRGFLQPGIHLAEITFCRIWTNTAHIYTHACARVLGQKAARGTLSDINLHSAEMCEAGRLRGGQWCRLRQGGHLGSVMLSYVPAGGPGEASTYEMVVNLH